MYKYQISFVSLYRNQIHGYINTKNYESYSRRKSFYEVFLGLGLTVNLYVILLKRLEIVQCTEVFFLENLNSTLKTLLSKIYHNKIDITINGKPCKNLYQMIDRTILEQRKLLIFRINEKKLSA